MNETFTIIIIAATFLLAGSVKGVIGLGLPTVSLGLLAATLDLTTAMALLLIPSFVTNIWQAVVGGNGKTIASSLNLKPELISVLIEEFERENWATGGELHSDKYGGGYGHK